MKIRHIAILCGAVLTIALLPTVVAMLFAQPATCQCPAPVVDLSTIERQLDNIEARQAPPADLAPIERRLDDMQAAQIRLEERMDHLIRHEHAERGHQQ